jgi:hypothetical protein
MRLLNVGIHRNCTCDVLLAITCRECPLGMGPPHGLSLCASTLRRGLYVTRKGGPIGELRLSTYHEVERELSGWS